MIGRFERLLCWPVTERYVDGGVEGIRECLLTPVSKDGEVDGDTRWAHLSHM